MATSLFDNIQTGDGKIFAKPSRHLSVYAACTHHYTRVILYQAGTTVFMTMPQELKCACVINHEVNKLRLQFLYGGYFMCCNLMKLNSRYATCLYNLSIMHRDLLKM